MENKEELETLVEELKEKGITFAVQDSFTHQVHAEDHTKELIRVLTLADKQGYMRGLKDALRVIMNERCSVCKGAKIKEDESTVIHFLCDGVFESSLTFSQAHDAISKLKGV